MKHKLQKEAAKLHGVFSLEKMQNSINALFVSVCDKQPQQSKIRISDQRPMTLSLSQLEGDFENDLRVDIF